MSPRAATHVRRYSGDGLLGGDTEPMTWIYEAERWLLCWCWCEARTLWIPRDEVLQGLTRSCGWAACHGPHGEIIRGNDAPQYAQGRNMPLREIERQSWAVKGTSPEVADRRDRVAAVYASGTTEKLDIAVALGVSVVTVANDLSYLRTAGRVAVTRRGKARPRIGGRSQRPNALRKRRSRERS